MSKKEKYLQIFKYLHQFSKIRERQVRDIESNKRDYTDIIWFDNIPDNKNCGCVIKSDYNKDNEYWIQIIKPKEVELPEFTGIPDELQNWVDIIEDDSKNHLLHLKNEAVIESIVVKIEDKPEIKQLYQTYLKEQWEKDLEIYSKKLESYKDYEKTSDIYEKLFKIFNKAQDFGEEYELIVGVGLLNYQEAPNKPKVFRHIITQKVDINYHASARIAKIEITPNIESLPAFETESFSDLPDYFDSKNVIDAQDSAEKYLKEHEIDNIFTESFIPDSLKIFADRFSEKGKYIETETKPSNPDIKPTIYFSPALIMRKRNTRSFTVMYEKIIKDIEESGDEIEISSLNDIIEPPVGDTDKIKPNYNNDFVYFPKEYNKEQFEIVENARVKNKVLVQGPPGTGKSHTIANLICHLLANGKKILITAYTKRALEVLKEKLPDEFRNLSVNLLSNDSSSMYELQTSVNAITEEITGANLSDYESDIKEYEDKVMECREKISFNKNEIVKIKESSTRYQELNENYKGTLNEIAEKLDTDKNLFDWYKDDFCDTEYTKIYDDLDEYICEMDAFTESDIDDFNFEIPNIYYLPDKSELIESFKIKKKLENLNPLDFNDFDLKCQNYETFEILITELATIKDEIKTKMKDDFGNEILNSVKNGEAYKWKDRLNISSEIFEKIKNLDLRKLDRDVEVTYNSDNSIKRLKSDASVLLDYMKAGHLLSGVGFSLKKPFLPGEIKERMYFIDNVRINGSPCDTVEEFETVITDLELKQDLEDLSKIWVNVNPANNSFYENFKAYENTHNTYSRLIMLAEKINTIENEIRENTSEVLDLDDTSLLQKLINYCEYRKIKELENNYSNSIAKSVNYLSRSEFHPIAKEISAVIKNCEHDKYNELLILLEGLNKDRAKKQRLADLKNRINTLLPETIKIIDKNKNIISEIKNAVLFRDAVLTIKKMTDINYEKKLFACLRSYQELEKSEIAKLAAKKAWWHVVNNLQNNRNLRQHLEAWVQAIGRIGKTGKGKRALKFRKEAQKQMEKCKSSVPCWVMPLYKITETVLPEKNAYDYIIIDEASQLGPDAIFLLYISKNIIIVGDDKQTSPEYVGVNADTMNPHIRKFLKDIPFANFYGVESSFFDHAKRFCEGFTVLREHFRCMPEIIEFSNKNFYAPAGNGLYPLKQYSENRLEPLKTVYCQSGYTDGKGSNIVNDPEARLIAEKIKLLVNKEEYNDKTIGVITLQGSQQASLIEGLLLKSIGEKEYHDRKIICGNSASFQGDERDVIILSLVTAANHNRAPLTKPEDERRFNVAVSRAKEQIWLFHSVQLEDLNNTNDLRYKLLDHFKNYNKKETILSSPINRHPGLQPEPFDSWFEVDVYNDIVTRGYSVIPQYEVAKGKFRIDLVVIKKDGTKIAIECDGNQWHGAEQYTHDIMRQKELERCGWQFFRIKGYEYYTDRIGSMDALWNILGEPVHLQSSAEPEPLTVKEPIIQAISVQEEHGFEAHFDNNPDAENKDNVIRYFNLNKSGTYVMTENEPLVSDYIIKIHESERNGYLLQCYNSGHINKVVISSLLNKKLNKEYMNGLNVKDEISEIFIVPKDEILGMVFLENSEMNFKAHLTENIPKRDLLHLQGYKGMYKSFDQLSYVIIPIELFERIERLVYKSFNSSGKALTNKNYSNEWKALENYLK